ncbi:MAG: T9SS type A sorting domain-containing protein [Candidatus Poribacteria bacterium]|nr:T9SS type A sorting domain-containing protein [Candidatus Poribacteria bacterium]
MKVHNKLIKLMMAVVLCLHAAASHAGLNEWTRAGEPVYGGIVRALAAHDGTIYAGTWGDGVFRSTNLGGRWESMGLASEFIVSMETDPSNPRSLYAGTVAALFKTGDAGDTWWYVGLSGVIRSIAVDPLNPERVYVAVDDQGIKRSLNGSDDWESIGEGIPNAVSTRTLAVDPRAPGRVYAGTTDGMFVSDDGGDTWRRVPNVSGRITRVVVHPTAPGWVVAATWGNGVYLSQDGGDTWRDIFDPSLRRWLYELHHSVAFDPINPETIYVASFGAGVLTTRNGGATWTVERRSNGFFYCAMTDYSTGHVYLGTEGDAVYRKAPGQPGWVEGLNVGMTNAHVKTVAQHPLDPTRVYAATWGGGVYRSDDEGKTWGSYRGGVENLITTAFALDPTNPFQVYIGTDGNGVYRSVNRGTTWLPASEGLRGGIYTAVAVDPTTPSRVYSGNESYGVYASEDGGRFWRSSGLKEGAIWSLNVHPVNPDILVAGTWGEVRFGSDRLGIFRSTDRGRAWHQVLKSEAVVSLAQHPTQPDTLYAGTYGTGVWRSLDAGATWAPINHGLWNETVWQVAIDPSAPDNLYAATWGGGIFHSGDAGKTWEWFGNGLPSENVYSVSVDPRDGNHLFAGTSSGVYEMTRYHNDVRIAGEDTVRLSTWSDVKLTDRLFQNFPNPFNPETWIPFELAEAGDARIELYDASGTRVRTLALGERSAGTYIDRNAAAYWDGRNDLGEPLPSGMYFYKIRVGSFTETKKMLLLK